MQLISDEVYHGLVYEGAPDDQLRMGDVTGSRCGQQLFEILRDDRLAAGLAAGPPGIASRGGLPDGQLHDLPARAAAIRSGCRVHSGVDRRGGGASASLRRQPGVVARRAAQARHRPAGTRRRCVLRICRRVPPDRRLDVVLLETVGGHRGCDRAGHRFRHRTAVRSCDCRSRVRPAISTRRCAGSGRGSLSGESRLCSSDRNEPRKLSNSAQSAQRSSRRPCV